MGYDDEAGRSRRRQSRGQQPVKRPGGREPEYRRYTDPEPRERAWREEQRYREEPHHKERGRYSGEPVSKASELNLITDSFRTNSRYDGDDRRQSNSVRHQSEPARSRKAGSRPSDSRTAARQTAAASQGGSSAYLTPEKKKVKKRKKRLLIILLEAVILLSVLAFAAYSYLNKSLNMMQKLPWNPGEIKNVEISEEKQEQMKGYWTIAVFGVDSRNTSVGKGNNSDVILICNMNQDTGEIKLVSVFRDTYLNTSDKNTYKKINAAYLDGGPEQAVKALNKNLDLDIDDYVTFNWKAVADAINILDGVDVELSKAEFYYINAFVTETVKATGIPSEPVKHAGAVHLDGVQAVAYGRLRLMDTDYARTERQRKIISLAFEKAKKANWATLNNIIQTVFPQVGTSVELPDVLNMGRDLGRLHIGETSGFPTARGDADMGSKGACVIPQTLESNVRELHQFLFGDENYEPTDTVKTISKKIITDTGLAKAKKPAGSADTDKGVVPKATKGHSETVHEGSAADESGTNSRETHESDEAETTRGQRPTESHSRETDSIGNVITPTTRESQEQPDRPGTTKPGTTNPETTKPETTKPGTTKPGTTKPGTSETTRPTAAETVPPRPGSGSGSGGSAPGSGTDTGVILGPGTGNSSGSSNVPGGGNSTAPGTGGSNTPGSGTGNNSAPGSGSGNVEFTGPPGQ